VFHLVKLDNVAVCSESMTVSALFAFYIITTSEMVQTHDCSNASLNICSLSLIVSNSYGSHGTVHVLCSLDVDELRLVESDMFSCVW
jgi:hypothetical protein